MVGEIRIYSFSEINSSRLGHVRLSLLLHERTKNSKANKRMKFSNGSAKFQITFPTQHMNITHGHSTCNLPELITKKLIRNLQIYCKLI